MIQSRYPELDYQVVREFVQTMPAFEVSKEAHIVKRLNDAYQKVRPGQEQPTGALNPQCLYGSDAGHLFTRLGMEGVVCGPGGKYNTMPDERVEVRHIPLGRSVTLRRPFSDCRLHRLHSYLHASDRRRLRMRWSAA